MNVLHLIPSAAAAARGGRRTQGSTTVAAGLAALALAVLPLAALAGCRPSGDAPAVGEDGAGPVTATVAAAAAVDAAPTADGAPASSGPGATPTIADRLAPEDEAQMVELIRSLFATATGAATADMRDVVVKQLTTMQLRQLRGEAGPSDGAVGFSAGYIWIVGFKTGAPITVSSFMPDPASMADLRDLDPDASLAGSDGLTTVYYIVSTQSIEGRRRFVPMSQGILVDGKSKWSLADLRAVPTP